MKKLSLQVQFDNDAPFEPMQSEGDKLLFSIELAPDAFIQFEDAVTGKKCRLTCKKVD